MDLILEEAALNAWPARIQALWGGWVLRGGDGYTKRSNSVTPLYDSLVLSDLAEKVRACESWYRDLRQPAIFRIVPIPRASELDAYLAQLGYQQVELSCVMKGALPVDSTLPQPEGVFEHHEPARWMQLYCQVKQEDVVAHTNHQHLLERIVARRALVAASVDEQPVACGIAVLQDGCVGLFDLVTAPQFRRQGYGAQLVRHLLQWGAAQGAHTAYLQVVANNEVARRLYDKLGFTEAYRYWYRQPRQV